MWGRFCGVVDVGFAPRSAAPLASLTPADSARGSRPEALRYGRLEARAAAGRGHFRAARETRQLGESGKSIVPEGWDRELDELGDEASAAGATWLGRIPKTVIPSEAQAGQRAKRSRGTSNFHGRRRREVSRAAPRRLRPKGKVRGSSTPFRPAPAGPRRDSTALGMTAWGELAALDCPPEI